MTDRYPTPGSQQSRLLRSRLIAEQDGLCAFCGQGLPEAASPPWRSTGDAEVWNERPVIDHNHQTDLIRSVVHSRCNGIISDCVPENILERKWEAEFKESRARDAAIAAQRSWERARERAKAVAARRQAVWAYLSRYDRPQIEAVRSALS